MELNTYKIIKFASLYDAFNNINITGLDLDWSRKNNKNHSPFHSISSYLAMFAPALPDYFIKKYSKKNYLVLDPFSGRGTTALVARELKRRFIGLDLNPYSYVLTKAKIVNYDLKDVINLIDDLQNKYCVLKKQYLNKAKRVEFKELRYFYSLTNLAQLVFLREKLGKNWLKSSNEEFAVLAIALGLMHGPTRKNGSSIYFSLKMPNTISMSPNYVLKYSKKFNLQKPRSNIFLQIRNRITNKYDPLLKEKWQAKMMCYDALKSKDVLADNSIDLVVTSPPYLNIVNYTSSNWLKLWLLGYSRPTLRKDISLTDNLSFDNYIGFIKTLLLNLKDKLKIGAKVCLIVGDVHGTKLIEDVWFKIENDVPYKLENIYYDLNYKQKNKTTNMLNKKAGKATIIDKVLVIKKE